MYRNICYKINKEDCWQGEIHLFTWDKFGNRITQKYQHNSHLYFEDAKGDAESIYGTKLKRKEFKNIIDRKRFIANNPDLNYFQCNTPVREFLFNLFRENNEDPDFAKDKLRTHFMDIEVAVGSQYFGNHEIKIRKKKQ